MTPRSQLIFDKSHSVCSRTEECKNHSHTLKLKNSEVIIIKGCQIFYYINPLFHTNWTLLGLELEVVLHASSMSQAPLVPSCSICSEQAHSMAPPMGCWYDYAWCWVDPNHPLSLLKHSTSNHHLHQRE
jgi:hypothetical protein